MVTLKTQSELHTSHSSSEYVVLTAIFVLAVYGLFSGSLTNEFTGAQVVTADLDVAGPITIGTIATNTPRIGIARGTVAFRLTPNWDMGDGVRHGIFQTGDPKWDITSVNAANRIMIVKWTDNTLYFRRVGSNGFTNNNPTGNDLRLFPMDDVGTTGKKVQDFFKNGQAVDVNWLWYTDSGNIQKMNVSLNGYLVKSVVYTGQQPTLVEPVARFGIGHNGSSWPGPLSGTLTNMKLSMEPKIPASTLGIPGGTPIPVGTPIQPSRSLPTGYVASGLVFNYRPINSDFSGTRTETLSYTPQQNTFTLSAFVKPNAQHQIDPVGTAGVGGVSGQKYAFWPTQSGVNGGVGLSVGTNGISIYEHGNSYMPSRLVHTTVPPNFQTNGAYVSVVYQNKIPSLYVNGVLQTITPAPVASLRPSVLSPTIIGGGTYGYFSGYMDNISVYSRALTQVEVQQNCQVAGTCVAPVTIVSSTSGGMLAGGSCTIDANGQSQCTPGSPVGVQDVVTGIDTVLTTPTPILTQNVKLTGLTCSAPAFSTANSCEKAINDNSGEWKFSGTYNPEFTITLPSAKKITKIVFTPLSGTYDSVGLAFSDGTRLPASGDALYRYSLTNDGTPFDLSLYSKPITTSVKITMKKSYQTTGLVDVTLYAEEEVLSQTPITPTLSVTVAPTKTSYSTGEPVTATIRIENGATCVPSIAWGYPAFGFVPLTTTVPCASGAGTCYSARYSYTATGAYTLKAQCILSGTSYYSSDQSVTIQSITTAGSGVPGSGGIDGRIESPPESASPPSSPKICTRDDYLCLSYCDGGTRNNVNCVEKLGANCGAGSQMPPPTEPCSTLGCPVSVTNQICYATDYTIVPGSLEPLGIQWCALTSGGGILNFNRCHTISKVCGGNAHSYAVDWNNQQFVLADGSRKGFSLDGGGFTCVTTQSPQISPIQKPILRCVSGGYCLPRANNCAQLPSYGGGCLRCAPADATNGDGGPCANNDGTRLFGRTGYLDGSCCATPVQETPLRPRVRLTYGGNPAPGGLIGFVSENVPAGTKIKITVNRNTYGVSGTGFSPQTVGPGTYTIPSNLPLGGNTINFELVDASGNRISNQISESISVNVLGATGVVCTQNAECQSNSCISGRCAACTPSDVSTLCGGNCVLKCPEKKTCNSATDCSSEFPYCVSSKCSITSIPPTLDLDAPPAVVEGEGGGMRVLVTNMPVGAQIRLSKDGTLLSGTDAILSTVDATTYQFNFPTVSTATAYLTAGSHTFSAQLFSNRGQELTSPAITKTVRVEGPPAATTTNFYCSVGKEYGDGYKWGCSKQGRTVVLSDTNNGPCTPLKPCPQGSNPVTQRSGDGNPNGQCCARTTTTLTPVPLSSIDFTFNAVVGTCPTGWTCTGDAKIASTASSQCPAGSASATAVEGAGYFKIGCDGTTGTARSSIFILPAGITGIKFLRAGGADGPTSGFYVKRASDNQVLCSVTDGTNSDAFFENTCTTGLTSGINVYIELVDTVNGGWGKTYIDNIQIVTATPGSTIPSASNLIPNLKCGAQVTEASGMITFTMPANICDIWTTVDNAPSALRPATTTDFDVSVRASGQNVAGRHYGIVVYKDDNGLFNKDNFVIWGPYQGTGNFEGVVNGEEYRPKGTLYTAIPGTVDLRVQKIGNVYTMYTRNLATEPWTNRGAKTIVWPSVRVGVMAKSFVAGAHTVTFQNVQSTPVTPP